MKRTLISGVLLAFAVVNVAAKAAAHSGPESKVYNVRMYGAVGDGMAMDTQALQDAIDACSRNGGGTVRVPPGDYPIGTIWLRSNVRHRRVASNTAPLKFGTSSRGGFIDVSVANCYFYNSPMGAIKLEVVDGGRLENVDISRIVMEDVEGFVEQ